jgi:hypothetical protein
MKPRKVKFIYLAKTKGFDIRRILFGADLVYDPFAYGSNAVAKDFARAFAFSIS